MTNTPSLETWNRVELILDELLDLPEADLEIRLKALSEKEPELEKVIRSALLGADEARFDTGVESFASHLIQDMLSRESNDAIGTTLSVFRIEKIIGRGGMGVVYAAKRIDGQFEQQVAIKKLPIGILGSRGIQRFEEERSILAKVRHPYIAQLLDGGIDEEGLPFLVMELIDGAQRIDHFVAQQDLSIKQRLILFKKVCDAVSYLHQNLIIHGDIKPNNVLIRKDGLPKLIDFGISQLASFPQTTATNRFVGASPRYASPEQLNGEYITTLADIFSLGASLEKILQAESGDASNEKHPIPKELQAIIDKCKHIGSQYRYKSIDGLVSDIDAYLDSYPVQAYRQDAFYRAKKYIKRNWIPVSSLTAVAISLLAGLGYSINQTQRANNETLRATTVANFLTGIFQHSAESFSTDADPSIKDLIVAADKRLDVELKDTPDIKADMQEILGIAYSNLLSDTKSAEKHLNDVLSYLETNDPDNSARILSTLYRLAQEKRYQGDPEETKRIIDKAIEIDLRDGKPDGVIWMEKAFYEIMHGEPKEQEYALNMAEKAYTRQYGADSNEMATVIAERARSFSNANELEQAESKYRQAISMRERNGAGNWMTTVSMRNNMAIAIHAAGRFSEAVTLYETNLLAIEERLGRSHGGLVAELNNLGKLYQQMGDLNKAETLLERAKEIAVDQLAEKSFTRMATELNFASVNLLKNEPNKALQILLSLEQRAIDAVGDSHVLTAVIRRDMARAYLDNGDKKNARQSIDRCLPLIKRADRLAIANEINAEIYLAEANYLKAEASAMSAIRNYKKSTQLSPWEIAYARILLDTILLKQGKTIDAQQNALDKKYLRENLSKNHRALNFLK